LALLLLGLLAVAVPTGLLVAMGEEEAERPGVNGEEFEQSATDEPTLEEGSPAVEESEDEEPLALEVPDFVGLTFLEAEAQLAEAGLEIGELGEEISFEIPEGKVILQEPLAGAEVEPGAQLNLVVSAGPPKIAAGPPTGDAGLTQYPIQDVALPVGDVRYPDGTVQREPFVPAVPEVS
jgi:beta-lactam-binding protein with PASTA domain